MIRILSEFATELPEKYLTYNVGFMLAGATATVNDKQNGGTVTGKLNIVPGEGYALGDLRTLSDEQAERGFGEQEPGADDDQHGEGNDEHAIVAE